MEAASFQSPGLPGCHGGALGTTPTPLVHWPKEPVVPHSACQPPVTGVPPLACKLFLLSRFAPQGALLPHCTSPATLGGSSFSPWRSQSCPPLLSAFEELVQAQA